MKLNRLIIDNFRCFKHYQIAFAPGTTVLIGKNGTGKTSLIHAIHYALSFIFTQDRSMGDDFLSAGNPDLKLVSSSSDDFYRDNENGETAGDFNIHGEATFNQRELIWDMHKRSTPGAALFPTKYINAYRSFMEEYRKSAQLPLIAYFSDSFPHKKASLSDFAKRSVQEQGTIMRNFGYYQWDDETACTSVWELRFINTLIKYNSLGDKDISAKEEVDFIKSKLRTVSKTINTAEDIHFEIDELYFTLNDEGKPTLYVSLTNGRKIAFANLPAGYKRLYAIVMDIAYRAYILNLGRINDIRGIVIIDEIDLHLHPTLEQEILQRLQNTFPLIQFIVSTHSPFVVSNLNKENGKNAVISMSIGEESSYQLPNIYGADPHSIVYDFMGTPYSNHGISEIKESIFRLWTRGKKDSAKRKLSELETMLNGHKRSAEIIRSIEESLT
jgi:predicted ATP-binding protein involved in virulence